MRRRSGRAWRQPRASLPTSYPMVHQGQESVAMSGSGSASETRSRRKDRKLVYRHIQLNNPHLRPLLLRTTRAKGRTLPPRLRLILPPSTPRRNEESTICWLGDCRRCRGHDTPLPEDTYRVITVLGYQRLQNNYAANARKWPCPIYAPADSWRISSQRLRSLETVQATLLQVESVAGDIEVRCAYETSTMTLKTLLAHPSLNRDKIDETMEALAEAAADHAEIDEAIKLGGEGIAAAAGVAIDEDDMQKELEQMIEEKEKEEAEEREREKEREREREREEAKARQEMEREVPRLLAAVALGDTSNHRIRRRSRNLV
ncbi:hypothetical protein JB92DRAFT_3101264 [Gautieria morchelliformis]|nr:hypothetical protein JB92DRAFT_3101264 [Gautieria morchelliformis]